MKTTVFDNWKLVRAQAVVLVSMLIAAGSVAMAPAVLAADNSGNAPELSEPHGIIGYLYEDLGPVIPGVLVTVTNARTGETFTDITNALGAYDVDIAGALEYNVGDYIYVTTPEPNQGFADLYVDITFPYQWANITVDRTDPVIGATTVDKLYINNQGTFGGIVPPVNITVDSVTDNAAMGAAAWAIRDEFQWEGTMYFGCDITQDVFPSTQAWDGNYYHIAGALVTASVSPAVAGTDMFVFGEVDGASLPGDEIGNTLPTHYATFLTDGTYQGVYSTQGTLDLADDIEVIPIGGETFRPYRYDEGSGYIATAALETFAVDPWVTLTITPVPDGRYAVCVSAIDEAGNTAWTNETTPNPVITVDNFAPVATATGPDTSDVYIFNVGYSFIADPLPSSGILNVTLFYNRESAGWMTYGTDPTPMDGAFPVDVTLLGGDGTYEWCLVAFDNTLNRDDAVVATEWTTLVDTAAPTIGATLAGPLYVNNQGTFGGIAPPVTISTEVWDDNIAAAGWGIRDELQWEGTMYFTLDITDDVENNAMPAVYTWNGEMYLIGGAVVTASMSPFTYGTELFVMGEVNGASAPGDEIGNVLPTHYATFLVDGTYQSVYSTEGTLDRADDIEVIPVGGETFRPYRYDEGSGYIATAALETYTVDPWVTLTITPVPDGRYAICVTAVDLAQNSAWTNETTPNPVITVDNYPAYANATGPLYSTSLLFDVTYTFVMDPLPSSGMLNVSLWYNLNGGGWYWFGEDPTPSDGLFPVNLTLLGDGTYEWFIAAFDMARNHQDLIFAAEAWTLVDTMSPYVVTTAPLNGTTDVPLAAGTYVIQFSEPMDTAFGTVTTDLPGVAWTWSADSLWLNGTYTDLTESTIYNVDLSTGGFRDVLGNALIAGVYGWTFNFTALGIPPEVVTTAPLDGTTDYPVTAGIYVIQFNEPMDVLAGAATSDLPGVTWTWSADGIWLNGTYTDLTESTTYNVDLSAGGFTDAHGNALIAGVYGWTFNFTTLGIPPEVVTTSPLDAATDVPLAAGTYAIQFNEPMDIGPGTVTTDLPGAAWTWSGDAMWLNGTYTDLTESTTYTIDLSAGGFTDVYGNALVAGAYGWTFTFTTIGIAPTIESTSPFDGETGVALSQNIVITFSESINTATMTYACSPDPFGWAGIWSANDTILTLTHANFNEFSLYTFTVTFAEDLFGNALVAGIAPNPWSFETIGTFNLAYSAGWNLFGIPVLDPEVGGVPLVSAYNLTQLGASMVSKWTFATQRYTNFIAGFHLPGDAQNFALLPDEAYWAWMPAGGSVAISGQNPGVRSLAVDGPGWNMVSYMDPLNVGDVGTDWAPQVSCGAFDDIAYYDAGTFYHYIFPSDVMALEPGRGYFVWSDFPTNIDYNAAAWNANTGVGYSTIQAAINAASPYDTIDVEPGIYYEQLVITQPLTLQGSGSGITSAWSGDTISATAPVGTSIIDATGSGNTIMVGYPWAGSAITILSDDVTISGFEVSNSANAGVYLYHANYCSVSDVRSTGNYYGFYLESSGDNTLSYNEAYQNTYSGFELWLADWNEITDSRMEYNDYGLRADTCTGMLIASNDALANFQEGFDFTYCDEIYLDSNTVDACPVGVWAQFSTNVQIRNNVFTETMAGILYNAIVMMDVSMGTISYNMIEHHQDYAITLIGSGPGCTGITITENQIMNGYGGVYLQTALGGIQISDNDFFAQSIYSIYLVLSDALIHHNNFFIPMGPPFAWSECPFTIWDDGMGTGNYWDGWPGGPYPIDGPAMQYDFNPSPFPFP